MMIIRVLGTKSQKMCSMAQLHLHLHLLQDGLPQVKSPTKKKASCCRKKASLEKLPYEKSEEESKAATQKEYDDWKKHCEEKK
jgi:hypothetical protein